MQCLLSLPFRSLHTCRTAQRSLVEFRINGEDVPIDEQSPQQFTVENGELVQEATIQHVVYTFIYELQSAE